MAKDYTIPYDLRYFAAKEAKDTVQALEAKTKLWYNEVTTNGYLDKVRSSWAMYHGVFFEEGVDSHKISFSGDQGELVNLPVNHYRNIASHLYNMTTANRPSLNTRAINTDHKSMSQTILANGLLDYYLREKKLEKKLMRAAEYAIVMGEGYIKMEWDATSGEIVDYNEDTKTEIYEGDIRYTNLSSFDIVRDSNREDSDPDWVICRSYKNRFDLIAKYPELTENIIGLKTKDQYNLNFNNTLGDDTDLVPVYEFFHKRTDALPDGRYILYSSPEVVMFDGALPYRQLPVFRITPSDFIGAPYGYTSMFDLMPLQEKLNMLYSVIATNQNAFGVQNVLVPKGSDIVVSQLAGGLNIVEYTPGPGGGKPEPMNLTATPAEIFNMIGRIEQNMETLSGINSVTRGQPEASLKSGAALAMVQAQAVQFISGLQGSYVKLLEDVGGATINMLQDFAAVPRVANIAGISNRAKMAEFTGEKLDRINRVIVEVSNPISKTTAGRLEIANNLLQMEKIKNTDQYFTVLNTGRLDSMMEGDQAELILIKGENEDMLNGIESPVMDIDSHIMHILEHKAVLNDPELRRNKDLSGLVMEHIRSHIAELREVDPQLLHAVGQQPLETPIEEVPSPEDLKHFKKPRGEERANLSSSTPDLMEPSIQAGEQIANMPELPTPPGAFANMPTDPGDTLPE